MAGERPQLARRMEPGKTGEGSSAGGQATGPTLTAAIPTVAQDTRKDIERGYSVAVKK